MDLNSRLSIVCLGVLITAFAACSKKDDGVGAVLDDDNANSDTGDDDDHDDGNPGGGNPGGTSMDGGGVIDPVADAHVFVVDPPDASCAATSQEAKQVTTTKEVVVEVPREEIKPVAIYLMLDRSSSMVGVCPLNPSTCNAQSWNQATQAISEFVSDPASATLDVALGYFPPTVTDADKTATGPLCTGTSCAKPNVAMDKADHNAPKVIASLSASIPTNMPPYNTTPTECAIRGLGAFCKDHKARTGQKCVGVLVTDGYPGGDCSTDANNLATLTATAAMEGTPIFTLGLTGADFNFLNRIAMSGGTDCTPNMDGNACDVSAGKDAFLGALEAIRETVVVKETRIDHETVITEEPIDCEWTIPAPPMDMQFDKDKVNVRFSATGKAARVLGHVTSKEGCEKFSDGWYFDNEDQPSKVLACGQACEEIKGSKGARISIELGCQTQVLQ